MGSIIQPNRQILEKILISLIAGILLFSLFSNSKMLQGFELRVRSFLMSERGARPPHDAVFLVTVDNPTVAKLGWPLPRQHYVELIRTLNQYGAKVIAFDFFFDTLRDTTPDDSLAAISQRFNNVIHAFTFDGPTDSAAVAPAGMVDSLFAPQAIQPKNPGAIKLFNARIAEFPHPRFAAAFKQIGTTTLVLDEADRFHKLPLAYIYNGRTYSSLSLLAFCNFLGVSPDSVYWDRDFWGAHMRIKTPEKIYTVPMDRQGQVNLNYYGDLEAFHRYSLLEIHQAVQDLKAGKAPQVHLAGLKGKVVFVGGIQSGGDAFITPFSGDFPGMGVLATAVSNFLDGETLREMPWYVNLGLVLIFTLLLCGAMTLADKADKKRTAVYASLYFIAIVLLYNGLAYQVLFKSWNIVPATLATNGALFAGFVGILFYEKNWREKTLHQKVKHLEDDMHNTLAEISQLNEKINVRDEEFKTLEYFIGELENHFDQAAAEISNHLQPPLDRMKLIKEKIQHELDNLYAAKQRLQEENKNLASKIGALQPGETSRPASNAVAAPPAAAAWKKLDDLARVLEHYRNFEQKAAVKHHFNTKFGMVTPVLNGRLNGEVRKSKMLEVLEQISQIGAYDATVLITGETGTGKEKVAHAIQQHSRRKDGPFVVINMGALPEALIEDELFGHVKNAFTGAQTERKGKFELAEGGTIFLDEIGDLKMDLQVRLLRVLQEKTFYRVGGNDLVKVDVRIIAATKYDLEQLIREQKFRDDLYYRLNVARLHLPPLRERKEEIPHLIHYFLARHNEANRRQKRLTADAVNALILYEWAGNIRELQNVIERAYITSPGDNIRLGDLEEKVQQNHSAIFNDQITRVWEDVIQAAKQAMEALLNEGQKMLQAGNVEIALQAGQLQLEGAAYKNSYDYMRACLESKGSSFPQEQRETLARQTMVALAERLAEWCRAQKLNSMEICWKEIEKLLGRGRRQIDNWKYDLGLPPF